MNTVCVLCANSFHGAPTTSLTAAALTCPSAARDTAIADYVRRRKYCNAKRYNLSAPRSSAELTRSDDSCPKRRKKARLGGFIESW
jgi:hypothetical protein